MLKNRINETPELKSILIDMIGIAELAGREILRCDLSQYDVKIKSDQSPVTVADQSSNRVIQAALKVKYPKIPILSEEEEMPNFDVRKKWNEFFMVDPLDGTKEFIKKRNSYTVNLSYHKINEPLIGVIHVPALQQTYYGHKGSGSFMRVGHQKDRRLIANGNHKKKFIRITQSLSHKNLQSNPFSKFMHLHGIVVEKEINLGSSLKFCYLADDQVDFYPRFINCYEWDTAAGDCIYRNATLEYHQENFSPLQYNKEDLKQSSFVLGLSQSMYSKFLEFVEYTENENQ